MTKNWKKYQEVIKTLYISEGKTLEDVRTIMQEKHNFKASREYTHAPVQAPLQPGQTGNHWDQQPHDRWRNMAPLGPVGLPSPPADMDAFFMSPAPAASEMELAAPQPVHPQSTYPVLSHQGGGQQQHQHHHHQQQQQQMMMAQHHSSGRRYDPYQYPIRCYPRSGGSSEGYENQRPPGTGQ
ncbi:hypothetical protein CMUS01_02473 [Colletotrichum musicola]|uniref:Clr5 domain-containing protein n=1 Tax=Colletotrichum musicola TaxID=2175873 RepID=A0A8H6U7F9_9PEZI|nr:hypothetical protein CMUS01_02473 [Colletotrichum musicola]